MGNEGEDDDDSDENRNLGNQVAVNDLRAVELSKIMLARSWDDVLSPQERIFAVMPLRHSPTIKGLELVLTKVLAS